MVALANRAQAARPSHQIPITALAAAVSVALIAAALAAPHALHDPLWQDEVASARILEQPTLLAALHRIRETESTPPLWYILGWLLHRAGVAITQVRFLSVSFMSIGAALTVILARRVLSVPLAGLAGLLIAVGTGFFAHSHELRAYALLVLLASVFAIVLADEVREPTRRNEVALCMCTTAGLLTHYFFLFTLVSAAVWLWLEPKARKTRRRASVSMLTGCALFAPFAPIALSQYKHDHFWWIGRFSAQTVTSTAWRFFLPLYGHGIVRIGIAAMFLALAAVGSFQLGQRSSQGRLLVALGFGPLIVSAVVWSLGLRIFSPRNLLECGPFFAVLAVAWLEFLPIRLRLLLAGGIVVVAFSSAAHLAGAKATPFDRVASDLVAEGWTPGTPIALFNDFFSFRSPLEWYLPGHPPLALGVPTGRLCRTVFVITPSATQSRFGNPVRRARAGSLAVERLRVAIPIGLSRRLRGASWLIDPLQRSVCLKAVISGPFSARFSPTTTAGLGSSA